MQEFAGSGRTSADGAALLMMAGRRTSDPVVRFDVLQIEIAQVTAPGTYRFCRAEGSGCVRGRIFVAWDLYESGTAAYELLEGSFVVTEITRDRVRGTFQAPGTDLVARSDPGTIQVSGGSFDLPIFPYEPYGF